MKLAGEAQAELIKIAFIAGAVLLVGYVVYRTGKNIVNGASDIITAPFKWAGDEVTAIGNQLSANAAAASAADQKRINDFSQSPYDEAVNQGQFIGM